MVGRHQKATQQIIAAERPIVASIEVGRSPTVIAFSGLSAKNGSPFAVSAGV